MAAARAHKRIFMTGHVLRFHPAFVKLKSLIDNDELGEVKYIHSHRLGLGKFHTENDALWDLAPHDLSMILAITGTAPVEVRGEGAALLDHLSDFAHLHMRFPNGLRSHLFTSRLNPYRERRLTVVGTKAMAVFDDVEPWARKLAVYRHAVWQDSGQWAFTANEPAYVPVEEGMPLTRELEHFLECIETRAAAADQRRRGDRRAEDPDGRHRRPRLSRIAALGRDRLRRRGRKPRQHGLGFCAALGAGDEAAAAARAPRRHRRHRARRPGRARCRTRLRRARPRSGRRR